MDFHQNQTSAGTSGRRSPDPIERLRFELADSPYNLWLEATALEADDDRGELSLRVGYRPELGGTGEFAMFHGGVIAGVIDLAGHAVVAVRLRSRAPTIALQIEYLSPAIGPELVANAKIRKMGRTIARADVEISVGSKIVALGRGSFSVRETSA